MGRRPTVAASFALLLVACSSANTSTDVLAPRVEPRVVVVGLQGVSWDELDEPEATVFSNLLGRAAVGNLAPGGRNDAASSYAALGSGRTMFADHTSGWAFDAGERIENSTGAGLYGRRAGFGREGSAVYVSTIERLRFLNGLTVPRVRPGLLAETLAMRGGGAAVLGNADHSMGDLPDQLPLLDTAEGESALETGIHREVALAAMRGDGSVDRGEVGRHLLLVDPQAPFGIRTDPQALLEAFRLLKDSVELIVIESGDGARADAYAKGLEPSLQQEFRSRTFSKYTQHLIGDIAEELDPRSTLLVVAGMTTPGGSGARSRLRPVLLAGGGVQPGFLVSPSTNRPRLITMADLSATIAEYLGAVDAGFESGRAVSVIPARPALEPLRRMDSRAVVHDAFRVFPHAVAVAVVSVFALLLLLNRPGRRFGTFSIISIVAMPLASAASSPWVWAFGAPGAAGVVTGLVLASAGVVVLFLRRWPATAISAVLTATVAFFFLDLAAGSPAQVDSTVGYSSTASGRLNGIGDLGAAFFVASLLLLAGFVADRRSSIAHWAAGAILVASVIWLGAPALGHSPAWALSLLLGIAVFLTIVSGRASGHYLRFLAVSAAAGAVLLAVLGLLDSLSSPGARTYVGNLVSSVIAEPSIALDFVRQRGALMFHASISSPWVLALPAGVAILIRLRRSAAVVSVLVAGGAGSFLGESGLTVIGVMTAIAALWAAMAMSTEPGDPLSAAC